MKANRPIRLTALLAFVLLNQPTWPQTNLSDTENKSSKTFVNKSREYPTQFLSLHATGAYSLNSFFADSLDSMVKNARENGYPVQKKMTGSMQAGLGINFAMFPHRDKAKIFGYELGLGYHLPETTAYGYIPDNDENYTEIYNFSARRILDVEIQGLMNVYDEKGVFMYLGLGAIFTMETFDLESDIALQKKSEAFSGIGFGAKISYQIYYRQWDHAGWLMALELRFLPILGFKGNDGSYLNKVASEFGTTSIELVKPTPIEAENSIWDHHGLRLKIGYVFFF